MPQASPELECAPAAQTDAWIRQAIEVLRAAARGDLESRLGCEGHAEPPPESAASELFAAVDDALDMIDAYVRESRAALAHASQGQFYRRVVLTGMPGSYRQSAQVINGASHAMEEKSRELCEAGTRRVELAGEFDGFVHEVIASVAGAAGRLDGSCQALAGSAEKSFAGIGSVTEVARTLSSDVSSVAAATEELSATASEIRRQVQEASNAARDSVSETQQAKQTIAELARESERIGSVVKLISVIALNATIEAARAGEAGRGFAVVAAEVKKLARETARATDEISSTIASVQASTQRTVQSISRVDTQLARLEHGSQSIAIAVDQQAQATAEISTAVNRTAQGSNSLSATVAELASTTEATRAELGRLQQSSHELKGSSQELEQRAGSFLESVRAG